MILETANPEFDTLIETLVPKYGKVKVNVVHADGTKDTRRLGRAFDHAVMMYRKGSKRYGYYLEKRHFTSIIFPETKEKTENEKWVNSWTNVLNRLEKSGLWENHAKNVRTALAVGMDKIKQAYTAYWNNNQELSYEEDKQANAEAIKAIDERLVEYREDGSFYPDTDIIWYMYISAKIKKMYFGKYVTEGKLAEIKQAMETKTKFSTWGRAGYDVHFEYHPENKRAFYNEEYRGKGNGHYYIALDATHALFTEDD